MRETVVVKASSISMISFNGEAYLVSTLPGFA